MLCVWGKKAARRAHSSVRVGLGQDPKTAAYLLSLKRQGLTYAQVFDRYQRDHADWFPWLPDDPEYEQKREEAIDAIKKLWGDDTDSTTKPKPKDQGPKGPGSPVRSSQHQPETQQLLRKRLPRNKLLPLGEYTFPILEALYELGGRAPCAQVLDIVGVKLKDRLTELDLALKKSGEPRWRNRAQFQRLNLITEGLLRQDSDHGVWELSEAGLSMVEQNHR